MVSARPSTAELLMAEYGHAWEIWRELGRQGHGDWIARRLTDDHELRADTIRALAELLREVVR
ncbi:hypothetical protein [Actinocorallia sp. A-T 12471]|uniref:hypothetical protein n=1 Tax=Actinocorallia sp. A-T 12471 TaxID=3089813 RepID=UPI0029D20192|nr:hypothetical protein [Actinocorallia sp. A-T 12471]MDX6744638.1 hypothetical protein [Actinocorallia sp. A-T 12471]